MQKKLENWQRALVERGELYRVGGSVRDELMGIPHLKKDVDYLVRGVEPEELVRVLTGYGRVVLVGKSFGVYKFRASGEGFDHDLAFPRRETSTGSGHRDFDVKWDPNLDVATDLGRRDFTINAIAKNVRDESVVDPFGGAKDIEARVLRMIFERAFEEDPLRILRGVRFAARFALAIETKTENAMRAAVKLVSSLSAERIQEELTKLMLQCAEPSQAFASLRELGVLALVIPELDRAFGVEQNEYHPDDVFWHSVKSCDQAPADNLLVRWAALLHDLGKVDAKRTVREDDSPPRVVFYGHEKLSAEMAEKVLNRLRYSNDFVRRCCHLVEHHMYYYQPEWNRSTVRRFIRRVGEDNLDDLFALRHADLMSRGLDDRAGGVAELRRRAREEIAAEDALRIEDMAIDGNDVMDVLGIGPGERVGKILAEIFERVIEDPGLNHRDALLEILNTGYKRKA